MKVRANLWGILPLVLLLAAGCAKKADMDKPVEQVRAEAEKMSVQDLQVMAQTYAKEVEKQKKEANKIASELRGLTPKGLLGEEGKTIKEKVAKISSKLTELMKRYSIYADEYRKKGGDVSKIKID